ncbi:MAG: HAMP domain-containing protein, partial [Nitrospirae bacterium]|nr:HAMP domain-containing protein [Nitrospirota bacterium]MBF0320862.1 HAMP domain-containing protein [Nitrospirota bacterium]
MFLSIKSKVLLSHFISVLAIGMLLGASGYLYISEHVDSDETEHVDIIAKLMRLRLIEAIDRKKSIIQNILNGKEIDFYIEKYHEPVLVQFFSRYSKDFPILGYVNAQTSEEVRVVRGKVSSADKGISQLAAGTLQPDKIFISNVQYDVDLGVPAITFTIPKYSFFGDHLIGFLYGVSPVSDITNVLSDIELAESGFILLLDDKKNIIYPDSKHKTIGKLIEKTANSYQTAIKPTPVVKGVSRALVFGMDSIAAYTTVEETNWALMVVTPYAILTSEANKTLYSSAIILIIILTVSSVIFIIVTNNITNNIINPLRRFVTFTDMLSRGDYSQITGINTKDEIGVLAKSFNNMLVELDRTRHSRNSHLNELLKANEHLKQSQAQLVQSEKMA